MYDTVESGRDRGWYEDSVGTSQEDWRKNEKFAVHARLGLIFFTN